MSNHLQTCPNCGGSIPAESIERLCPKCALAVVAAPTDCGCVPGECRPPPALEAVAAAFPQLEILELIGAGGMGAVFKARQTKLERFVALKILGQPLASDGAFAERFHREARLLARLNHPGIVSVHDYGEAGGFFYLLMEFVDGVNLRQAMLAGRFTPAQALALVPKICEALQFAHDEGILHRDIKPENILLDTRGRVKIADFGIAKLIGDKSKDATLTASGLAVGTPHYMAPEQLEHPQDVDQRADVYSLGVVFYEMLTGELPIGRFAPPSQKTSVDPRVDDVVLRALEKERERRQHNAAEVKTEVEQITRALAAPAGSGAPAMTEGVSAESRASLGSSAAQGRPPFAAWERGWLARPSGVRAVVRNVLLLVILALAVIFGSFSVDRQSQDGHPVRRWSVGAWQPWLKSSQEDAAFGRRAETELDIATASFACGVAALLLAWLSMRLHRVESASKPPGPGASVGSDAPTVRGQPGDSNTDGCRPSLKVRSS